VKQSPPAESNPSGSAPAPKKSPLFIIFTTVAMDLVGFGMIVTLVGQYGKDLGASPLELGFLGASYSLAQFFFAPLWGRLSDRYGRRPILLMSLLGSTFSYLIFGYATIARSLVILIFARVFQGIFAANLSAAQAYIADVTTPEKRAVGMGMIGAAFGVGFVFGPVLGGVAANRLGLAWPGFIASAICGINFVLAWFRLPESLSKTIQLANRAKAVFHYDPLNLRQLARAISHPFLGLLLLMYFIQIFAFSNIEQTFGLFFQFKFNLPLGEAAEKTGYVLGFVGVTAALIQGLGLRKLVPLFGERRMLVGGLLLFAIAIASIPFGPSYGAYFLMMIPMALGRSMIDPSMSSLISKSAHMDAQGETFGISQGLGSLARATGPFCGLLTFNIAYYLPFLIASGLAFCVFCLSLILYVKTRHLNIDSRKPAA
jgi:DHA1 family tetracycline resistance protein-like MFS transporter